MQLRAAREVSGKTQAQVAKEAQISESQYQNIEYDKCEPGVRTAIRIAKALNSTVENLFGAATPDKKKEPDGNPAK
jgi:putative transcriptional regulator